MVRLSIKNTFFEVAFDDNGSNSEGEEDECMSVDGARSPLRSPQTSAASASRSPEKCVERSPVRSPSRLRAQSADSPVRNRSLNRPTGLTPFGMPMFEALEGPASFQIEKLNNLLGSGLRPNHALEAGNMESGHTSSCLYSVSDSLDEQCTSSCALSSRDPDSLSGIHNEASTALGSKRAAGSQNTVSTAASDQGNKAYCHRSVPRNLDLAARSQGGCADQEESTTLMIRNVPNRYTQEDLLKELEELGLGGTFDFLYMPKDKASKASVGYAFVNFVAHSWAVRCVTLLQGHTFTQYGKNKEASVSVAHLQGLEANLAHYDKPAGSSKKTKQPHRPLVLVGGDELLPPPR